VNTTYITLQNFILGLSALTGVILFCVTCSRISSMVQGGVGRKYSAGQLIMMLLIAIILCSLANYLNMGSHTVFHENAFDVATNDPWLLEGNINNVWQQLGLPVSDTTKLSQATVIFMTMIKALGLFLYFYALVKWFQLAEGSIQVSWGSIILKLIVGVLFFNFGTVLQYLSATMGYQISI
jgi:hypothetical protein